jgi:hypothetical protein
LKEKNMTGHILSKLRTTLYILLAITILAACTPTPTPAPAPEIEPEAADTATPGIPAAMLEPLEVSGNVWIEFPYQGQILPNEVFSFVVYASSAGGVGSISLTINGQGLGTGDTNDHSQDGSMSLVSVEPGWQPPAEGTYTLTAGAGGASAAVEFCIVTCDPAAPEEPGTATPTVNYTGTPTPLISPTPTATILSGTGTPTPYIQPATPTPTEHVENTSMDFGADPTEMDAGSCTTLYWTTEGYATLTLNSQSVSASGTKEECLCETASYTLTGTTGGGVVENGQVTVTVNGSCEVVDTDPPSIGTASFRWADCRIFGAAPISDPSGVSQAKFHYNLNNEGWHAVWMQDIGGGTWESEVGVLLSDGMTTPVGSIVYKIEAVDEVGNTTTTSEQEQGYNSCSG